MYIARVKENNGIREYKNSRPCHMCLHYMIMFGIKKVAYTTGCDENPIRVVNIATLIKEPVYVSCGSLHMYHSRS